MTESQWALLWSSLGPILSGAITGTIPLALMSFVLGLAIALGVALARLSRVRVVSGAARVYISIIRGTPLLVQLFVIFYGLPSVGILIDAFPAALIGFTLSVGAYTSEVIRAALSSISRGQWEASYAIGMTGRQTMMRTVVPQATRVAVPPLSNSFISLVKDTSLAAAITVPELFQQAQRIVATTYEPLILYIEAALLYLVVSSVLSSLQARLEKHYGRYGGYLETGR